VAVLMDLLVFYKDIHISPLIEVYTEGDFVLSHPFYSFIDPDVFEEKTVICEDLMYVILLYEDK
jgi:hypothetical protein